MGAKRAATLCGVQDERAAPARGLVRSSAVGGRGRGRRAGAGALLAPMLACLGCAQPTVEAVAVWIDVDVEPDGSRAIQIYDGGVRRSVVLEPTIASSSSDLLRLIVAPRGIGFTATAMIDTVYVDLRDGGKGRIDPRAPGIAAELEIDVAYTRHGNGVRRLFADEERNAIVFLPTPAGVREPFVLELPESSTPGRVIQPCRAFDGVQQCLQLLSAAAAPVLFAVELGIGPSPTVDGRIVAWGLPGDDTRGGQAWAEPTRLAVGELRGRDVDPDTSRIEQTWCRHGVCITPDGEAAITMAPDADGDGIVSCELLRWRWDGPREPGEPPEVEVLPLSWQCPTSEDPFLVAALAPDLVVLDDGNHVHLTDLTTGAWVSTPKLGSSTVQMLPAEQGRAMLFVANNGAVSRADATGIRIVSGEHAVCSRLGDPIVSPSGNWVVQSCLGDTSQLPVDFAPIPDFGSTVRISALGLERFDGIPMRALAVDDDGNTLLYSFDADDGDRAPRGLFVLDASGQMVRVDELEPAPRPLMGTGYFSAQPKVR